VRPTLLVKIILAGVLGVLALLLVPPWLRLAWSEVPRSVRRQLAISFLDALLVGYAAAVGAVVVIMAVVVVLRVRLRDVPAGRTLRARLLSLCVSILFSLMILDACAAAWHAWLRSTPRLPGVGLETVGTAPASSGRSSAVALPGQSSSLPAPTIDAPLRILVIGESSGRGEPYHPWLSVGQIVAWKLESVFPGRPIQIDIWATGGATLGDVHNQLARLTYRPDALIVYVGHNEFQGRYPWMRDVGYYLDDVPSLASPEALKLVLRYSPLCRLALETWERQRVSLRPPRAVTRELIDRPVCTAEEAQPIITDFRRRLEAIAGYCEAIGTLPIFVIPPSNDGGFDPSRSTLAPATPQAERLEFARSVMRARALENKGVAEAIRVQREVVNRHPEFAETQYRLARLLEQTGAWDEARQHYIQARECDGMPLRCPEAFRQAFRDVATRFPNVLLVDGPRVLEAASWHGILDDRLFHDAQHPNLRGYVALAQDVLNQLRARRAFGWHQLTEAPQVDVGACARHFRLDASRWAEVCRRVAAFYRLTAYIRYDPKFRNQRALDYLRAEEAIAAGRPIDEAGIPGWGMLPLPSPPSHRIPLSASTEPPRP
jgi:hypothetical protein